MNDIERAIEVLKMDNDLMEFDPNTGEERPIESQNELNQCAYKANLLAISALEKQIPKKPRAKHYEDEREPAYIKYKCPNGCGSRYRLLDNVEKYCMNCGQAIDWSVEE